MKEEYRLTLENKEPRKIFGPKQDEVTGQWRRLHKEELHDLYSLPKYLPHDKRNERNGKSGMYGGEENCIHGFGRST